MNFFRISMSVVDYWKKETFKVDTVSTTRKFEFCFWNFHQQNIHRTIICKSKAENNQLSLLMISLLGVLHNIQIPCNQINLLIDMKNDWHSIYPRITCGKTSTKIYKQPLNMIFRTFITFLAFPMQTLSTNAFPPNSNWKPSDSGTGAEQIVNYSKVS